MPCGGASAAPGASRTGLRRSGRVGRIQIKTATSLPGNMMLLEAGDLVPAVGRIFTSATSSCTEASTLTQQALQVARRTSTAGGCSRSPSAIGRTQCSRRTLT